MGEGLHGYEELPEVRLDIRKEDIRPEIPEEDGTVLVLQVNARDDRRDPNSPEFGQLIPEAAQQAQDQAKNFFHGIFEKVPVEERDNVSILVVTSDAELKMPGGTNSPHKRAFETGEKVIAGISEAMSEFGIKPENLLNNSSETARKPVTMANLVDLTMWKENPAFVDFLVQKYGDTRELWKAYETDTHLEERLEAGAEGPTEIAMRTRDVLTDITQGVATEYHRQNPGKRLYVWVVGQYDNFAPAINGYVYQADPTRIYTPMEKGGGIAIKIDKNNTKAETTVGGNTFEVPAFIKRPDEAGPRYISNNETK